MCVLPLKLLADDSSQRDLLRMLAGHYREVQQHLLLINRNKVETRLATFLLYLATRVCEPDALQEEFVIPMRRRDIADYLGVTVETVSRGLSRFEKDGLIVMKRKICRIADLAALRELALA